MISKSGTEPQDFCQDTVPVEALSEHLDKHIDEETRRFVSFLPIAHPLPFYQEERFLGYFFHLPLLESQGRLLLISPIIRTNIKHHLTSFSLCQPSLHCLGHPVVLPIGFLPNIPDLSSPAGLFIQAGT